MAPFQNWARYLARNTLYVHGESKVDHKDSSQKVFSVMRLAHSWEVQTHSMKYMGANVSVLAPDTACSRIETVNGQTTDKRMRAG